MLLSGLAEGFTPAEEPGDLRPLAQDPLFQARFDALSYQLGVVISPSTLTPAETLGYNGFVVQAETALTTRDTKSGGAENYWALGTEGEQLSGALSVLALKVRKGLPYSLEVGAGLAAVARSRMLAAQADVKWSLLEGFQEVPFLPDFSLRAGVSRLLGASDLDLTTVTAGGMLSKPIGVKGSFSLTPFVSYERLFVIALSQVIDFTPEVSALDDPADIANNDVFRQARMQGNRFAAGLRVIYTRAVVTASVAVVPSSDPNVFTDISSSPRVSEFLGEPIRGQATFQLAVGADF